MKVRMLTMAAGPEFILHAGKVYDLPKELAERFLAGREAEAGVPAMRYAVLAPPGAKVERIPARPDPEDVPANLDIDSDDEE